MEELEDLLDRVKSLGWGYEISSEEDRVELHSSSPLGEDLYVSIQFNKEDPVESFVENLKEYYLDFDAEEHAEIYLRCRGEHGVPSSIRELLDDAVKIKEMLSDLWEVVFSATRNLG